MSMNETAEFLNGTNSSCKDAGYDAAYELYTHFSWWTEYVIQSIIGVAGIAANTVAIPVLCSREMNSIFNRLLMFLAIFDNFFIICQMLEAKRKTTNTYEDGEFNQVHEYVFGYFLYQLHAFVLCCSIYITVALALERYRAVWRPVEYHNKIKGVNPWQRVIISYVLPVLLFSLLFNIPKCFEIQFKSFPYVYKIQKGNNETSEEMAVNITAAYPTDLRLNKYYVIGYANLARLLVQGFIPFISLSFLNYRIYWVMRRRRELINRPTPRQAATSNAESSSMVKRGGDGGNPESSSAQRKANEAKQAFVLFIIVLLFFICHTPRFIINIHEFLNLDLLKKGMDNNCDSFPVWALASTSVSHCLMTLNSSSNFYIYCFMCSTFRDVLRKWILRFCAFFTCICCTKIHTVFSYKNGIVNNEEQATIAMNTMETKFYTNKENVSDMDHTNKHDTNTVCINKATENPDGILQATNDS